VRRVRTARALAASIVVAAGLLSACGSTTNDRDAPSSAPAVEGYPRSLTNCGVAVTVPAPPQRAISINQPATELMLTLGLADHMVGTASWNDPVAPALAAANAKVPELNRNFPSLEAVLAKEPDFVYATFAYTYSGEGVAPRDRFEKVGIPTYLSSSECSGQDAEQDRALRFDDLYAEINDIAHVFGVDDKGQQLVADVKKRVADASAGVAAADTTLGFWYSSTHAPYMAGCCGAPGMITEAVGAKNAFADSRQLWPETSWESILARDPDVLVLADLTRGEDGDSAEAKIHFLETDPVARQLTAVKERRYVILPGTALDPSLRNADAVEAIGARLRAMHGG
jgi:iron complex transport system substrate-binding protein